MSKEILEGSDLPVIRHQLVEAARAVQEAERALRDAQALQTVAAAAYQRELAWLVRYHGLSGPGAIDIEAIDGRPVVVAVRE